MTKREVRIGYYSESKVNEETGETEIVLKAHDPDAQRFFERSLRAGTKRRIEEGREPGHENTSKVKKEAG